MDTQTIEQSDNAEHPPVPPVPGIKLIEALKQRGAESGISVARVAAIVGVSRSYLNSLSYGQRHIPALSRKVLQACADYLGIPYVNAALLAEVISPADFMLGTGASRRVDLTRAMTFISTDPKLQGFSSNWQRLDDNALLLIIQLYEQASGMTILSRSKDTANALSALRLTRQ